MEQPRQHVTLKPGTCLAVNTDGTYRVLPDSGRGSGIPIDGVRPILEADVGVGDRIVLAYQRANERTPEILVTGDAGGESFNARQGWADGNQFSGTTGD